MTMPDYILGQYKCPTCGWVHIAITREFAIANNYDLARLERCFRCGTPSVGFVPAQPGDAPTLSTLQAVVLKADGEDLARIQALCIPRRGDR
jgi:hypothetical protein